MKHLDPRANPQTDAARLAALLAPVIAGEIADIQKAAAYEVNRVRAIADREQAALLTACRLVGQAVDKLEQAKFAGQAEIGARLALERHARNLRTLMDRQREARRHGR